jgi:hypothetical protein
MKNSSSSASRTMAFIKKFALDMGRWLPLVFTALFFHLFSLAYLSPHKAVLAKINVFGEADLEMIVMVLVIPAMVYYIIHSQNLGRRICSRE